MNVRRYLAFGQGLSFSPARFLRYIKVGIPSCLPDQHSPACYLRPSAIAQERIGVRGHHSQKNSANRESLATSCMTVQGSLSPSNQRCCAHLFSYNRHNYTATSSYSTSSLPSACRWIATTLNSPVVGLVLT